MSNKKTGKKRKPIPAPSEPKIFFGEDNCGTLYGSYEPPASKPRTHLPEPVDYYPH